MTLNPYDMKSRDGAQLSLDLGDAPEELYLLVEGLNIAFAAKTVSLEGDKTGLKLSAAHDLSEPQNLELNLLSQRCTEATASSGETFEEMAA